MVAPLLIGVGASAGGVEALTGLVSGLDADLPAAVLVVLHQPATAPTVLPEILARHCALEVVPARSGDVLRPGRVHVSIPDRHLQVVNGRVLTTCGPQENGHRPGVDPLFRSLALDGGPRATGVVLSGLLDDGAAGLLEIVRHGGGAVVQDPGQALHDGMPRSALAEVPGAVIRPAHLIGPVLHEITARTPLGGHRPSSRPHGSVPAGRGEDATTAPQDLPRSPAGPVCPDCAGPLFDAGTGDRRRHRCRSGRAWPPASPDAARDDVVERALRSALRALEDRAVVHCRVAQAAQARGAAGVAAGARAAMRGALVDAAVLRRLLTGGSPLPDAGRRDEIGDEGR